jgi:hypothetical protein
MTIQAKSEVESEPFLPARRQFDEIVARLNDGAMETLAVTEEYIRVAGLELQRLVLQGRLDVLFERERAELALKPPAAGVLKRARTRKIETQFGTVTEKRHGLRQAGKPSTFSMDEQLNVPAEQYSHPLRRRVAEEVRDGSFDRAVKQIQRTTAGHVPKRQAQQLTQQAAADVEAFYSERAAHNAVSDGALLVMSADGCAIRMVAEGLREATRKEAEKLAQYELGTPVERGDPTASARIKPHQTRRVMVTAVWDQDLHTRTAEDVIANLQRASEESEKRKKARGPRPQNKRLTASVEQDLKPRIVEMFDEADRRDPRHEREVTVLLDGDEHQTAVVKEEAVRRGRSLTIVLDLLHAMHYLWLAAKAIRGATAKLGAVDEIVTRWTILLLTKDPSRVVATIRSTATRLQLRGAARKQVDAAADYLLKRTPFIDYATFIARGLPIASGVIEGACRHLVRDRLDITGARWDVPDAEAVARLRAVRASGDWDEYWAFHERKDAERNYARAA